MAPTNNNERIGPQYEHDPASAMKAIPPQPPYPQGQPESQSGSYPPQSKPESQSNGYPPHESYPASATKPAGSYASRSADRPMPGYPKPAHDSASAVKPADRPPPAAPKESTPATGMSQADLPRPETGPASDMSQADRPPPGPPQGNTPSPGPRSKPSPPSPPRPRCFKDAGGVEVCYHESFEHANKTDVYDHNGTYDRHNDYHDVKTGSTNKNITLATNNQELTHSSQFSGDGGFRDTHIEQGTPSKSPVYEDHKEDGTANGGQWASHATSPDGSKTDLDAHVLNESHALTDIKDKDGSLDTIHSDFTKEQGGVDYHNLSASGQSTNLDGHLSADSNHQSAEHQGSDGLYTLHEDSDSRGDFDLHLDSAAPPNPSPVGPSMTKTWPSRVWKRGYPPATYTLPVGSAHRNKCGRRGPNGSKMYCNAKAKAPDPPKSTTVEAVVDLPTPTVAKLGEGIGVGLPTVWVDAPQVTKVTKVGRDGEDDGDMEGDGEVESAITGRDIDDNKDVEVDGNAEDSITKRDIDDLPVAVQAYTILQAVPMATPALQQGLLPSPGLESDAVDAVDAVEAPSQHSPSHLYGHTINSSSLDAFILDLDAQIEWDRFVDGTVLYFLSVLILILACLTLAVRANRRALDREEREDLLDARVEGKMTDRDVEEWRAKVELSC